MGSMYSLVLFIGAQNAASVQPVVTVERTVFYREQAVGMYSSLSYALAQILFRHGLECDVLETLCIKEQSLTNESAEEVVALALIHHLMQNSEANLNAKLTLSGDSIQYGLGTLQPNQNESNSLKSLKDVVTENEFEKKLLHEVIPPNDIGVTFENIGGQENVKETLKDLVMLPSRWPPASQRWRMD